MYSSTTKSLRSTGIRTPAAISCRYSSRPKNQNGSVKHDIAAAPARSYSRATASGSMSGAIMPFEGDAFFTSQMNCTPARSSATSKGNPHGAASRAARRSSSVTGPPSSGESSAAHVAHSPARASSAARRTLASDRAFFSAATRSRVFSAISSRMFTFSLVTNSPALLGAACGRVGFQLRQGRP